jgi:phosphatidate cytidylyltransferase
MIDIHPDMLLVIGIIFGILVFATVLFEVLGRTTQVKGIGELKARTRSWWVMAGMFVAASVIDRRISYVAIALLSFMAFRELYALLGFRQSDRRAILWAFLGIPVQYYLAYIGWYGAYIIFIPVVMFLLLPLRFVLKGDMTGVVKSMAQLQWILMLTVFGISHLAYMLSLPDHPDSPTDGRGLLLFVVLMTELNDVMQFTWGKLFGRFKIMPKVSPNKTWEGFLGGLLSTTVIGYYLSFLTPLEGWVAAAVSAFLAFAGFVGDVVMSAVKRDIGVKDTGTTIPGHGGILDRIDSLAYTAPAVFHMVYWIEY